MTTAEATDSKTTLIAAYGDAKAKARAAAIHQQIAKVQEDIASARALHAERAGLLVDEPNNKRLLEEIETLEDEIGRYEKAIERFRAALSSLAQAATAEAREEERKVQAQAAEQAKQIAKDRVELAAKVDEAVGNLRAMLQELEDTDTRIHRATYDALHGLVSLSSFHLAGWCRISSTVQPITEVIGERFVRTLCMKDVAATAADRLAAKIDAVRAGEAA